MVHLILIVILAGWHNLSLLLRIGIDTPDISAGSGKQDHPIPTSSNAVLLNIFARLKNPSWANPAVASASILESATRTFPETTPSAPPSYSGKKTIFLKKIQRAILLQTGGDLWYFTKPRIKDFSEQPTKLQPPPAPNIGSPAVRSIPKRTTQDSSLLERRVKPLEDQILLPNAMTSRRTQAARRIQKKHKEERTNAKKLKAMRASKKKERDLARKQEEKETKTKADEERKKTEE
jgi:hypothetical protein